MQTLTGKLQNQEKGKPGPPGLPQCFHGRSKQARNSAGFFVWIMPVASRLQTVSSCLLSGLVTWDWEKYVRTM